MIVARPLLGLALCLLLGACVTQTVKSTAVAPVKRPATAAPEEQLLDVAVVVFNPGLDDLDADEQVFPEVRKAEARFMPMQLSEALQESGAWGAVRVVPSDAQISDLMVRGKILHSDGEELQLEIIATDSRGEVWLDKTYSGNANRYSYEATTRSTYDPFQEVYNTIANDLLEELEELPPGERRDVRAISELMFARSFSPDAFDGYLEKTRRGEYQIQRLPAEDDPMLARVRAIRERDRQYIDTLQGYYTNFDAQMYDPYQEWRKNSYATVIELQEIQAESTRNLIIGGVAVLAGIAAATSGDSSVTRTAGQIGVLGGGLLVKSGLDKRNEAEMHVAELDELGASLEAEVAPQNIELEDHTVTLTGNVEEQYAQWRAVLADIYRAEIGALQLPEDAAGGRAPGDPAAGTTDTL
jgi:outer membrane lipoprotein SlyB